MAEVLAVLVSVGLGVGWSAGRSRAKEAPGRRSFALALIVTAETVSAPGRLARRTAHGLAGSADALPALFAMLVVVQGRFLWKPRLSA